MNEETPVAARVAESANATTGRLRRPRLRRRVRIGLAIEPDAVTAVELRWTLGRPRPGLLYTRTLEPRLADGSWPGLADAFQELRGLWNGRPVHADLALLRPLARVKTLSGLPPLNAGGIRQLVEQNAPRFFPCGDEGGPLATDAVRLGAARRERSRGYVLAAAAERILVETVFAAAKTAGLRVEAISASSIAAARGALALAPRLRRERVAVALIGAGCLEVLFLERGVFRLARSVPNALLAHGDSGPGGHTEDPSGGPTDDAHPFARWIGRLLRETAEAGFAEPERLVVVGAGERREALAVSLESGAAPLVARAPELEDFPPAALAAFGAGLLPAGAPLLVPDAHRFALRQRDRRRTAVLATASAALLAVSGGLHLMDLNREAAAVKARRATLRPAVEEMLRARSAIAGVRDRLATLHALEESRPHWTATLAALADALPNDAHLIELRNESGEIHLEARARSAASVIPALERSRLFQNARLVAPVRREETPLGAYEHLSLAVEVETRAEPAGSRSAEGRTGKAETRPRLTLGRVP